MKLSLHTYSDSEAADGGDPSKARLDVVSGGVACGEKAIASMIGHKVFVKVIDWATDYVANASTLVP